ncbi:major facilitator superfamily domain-containing protein [Dipodascopsis uninucleata]
MSAEKKDIVDAAIYADVDDGQVKEVSPAAVEERVVTGFWNNCYEAIRWYPYGMSKEEKLLLFKIDFMVLTFTCLSNFSLALDTNNVRNSYVSGMKEALNLQGNDLNLLIITNSIPYCAFMIPGTMLLTIMRPSIIMPICEFMWGIFTLAAAWSKTLDQLYAFRFLVGFFGAISYAGSIYVIGSWYKRKEVSRRLGLYAVSSPLGSMFSGYLQTAAYTNLDGVRGLEGWRWLFIICAIITFPVALWGFIAIPDIPQNTRSIFLNKKDRELCLKRVTDEGVKPPSKKFNWAAVVKSFKNWKWYLFTGSWVLLDQNEQGLTTPMSLYLKANSNRFSVPRINNLPTVTNAISVITTLSASFYTDYTGDAFYPSMIATVFYTSSQYMLVAWDHVNEKAKFYAWFMSGSILVLQSLLMTWAARRTQENLEERAFITASMNCLGNALKTGTNIVSFATVDSPKFTIGYRWSAICGSLQIAFLIAIQFLCKREDKRARVLESLPSPMYDDISEK